MKARGINTATPMATSRPNRKTGKLYKPFSDTKRWIIESVRIDHTTSKGQTNKAAQLLVDRINAKPS